MEQKVVKFISDKDNTYYAKFLQNERKIRSLSAADPKSYAAVVVRSMDHLITAKQLMAEHAHVHVHNACCVATILSELSASLRASELFALWTPDQLRNVQDMADKAIESEGNTRSDLDRDARVCLVISSVAIKQTDVVESIKFVDVCRKKYPHEVFFQGIYADLFTYAKDLDSGLKASQTVSKLFPKNADVLNSRAGILRRAYVQGEIESKNWRRQREQIENAKDAFKTYLKFAPKDHQFFAENNYVLAYLSLQYSKTSSQMTQSDLRDISIYFQNGLNAENDILPCFLPFHSWTKEFVANNVNMVFPAHISIENETCTIDLRASASQSIPTHIRTPTKRRIDLCVSHREQLKTMLSDPATVDIVLADGRNDNQLMDSTPPSINSDSNDFKEIILYQMTLSNESQIFTAKVFQLTVVEDSMYHSGHLVMVVADTTGDVIKLKLDLGAGRPESATLKGLMRKFRFGTVWKLRNPDFHMENGDESAMYIRATPQCLISTNDRNDRKCRICFKTLNPGANCAKCKIACYCGKECQAQDWKYLKHNLICSEAYANLYK